VSENDNLSLRRHYKSCGVMGMNAWREKPGGDLGKQTEWEGADVTRWGRVFQVWAAATGKAWSPTRSLRIAAEPLLNTPLVHWTSCHGCHKRRVDMKALPRYQLILLGKQRHIGVNNLPMVVVPQCRGRELNPRPPDHESNTLATTPPSHHTLQAKFLKTRDSCKLKGLYYVTFFY